MSTTDIQWGSAFEKQSEEVREYRTPDYPVAPIFVNRWSSRSFDGRPVADETLYTVLEAARWAPSSSNRQPWRFIIARTEEEHELFRRFIMPGNRLWTDKAPVLILVASDTLRDNGDFNGAHAFDAGAAWGTLALQAHLLGLSTRAAGGFDRAKAREVLDIPAEVELHAVVALGYRGALGNLHEQFHDREKPTARRSLADSILPTKARA